MSVDSVEVRNDSFLHGSGHLMKSWKKIRSSLTSDLSDIEHLTLVDEFWRLAPISSYPVLNWDAPAEWADPWNLISSMEFDESAVSLAMKYTLSLAADSRWTDDRLSLLLIKDDKIKIQRIILCVDNNWYLNYEYKTIINQENQQKRFVIQQEYSYNGKMYSIVE